MKDLENTQFSQYSHKIKTKQLKSIFDYIT